MGFKEGEVLKLTGTVSRSLSLGEIALDHLRLKSGKSPAAYDSLQDEVSRR